MLKAIELSGFKSFADKTRMEFASGISALVGPNGSGKSNVVDAIKWVLGEQSIKKLRGSEMTDVIFNGSGTRQPVQTAEVTLTFDNSSGVFDIESKEMHITRRVYRSGEGEYLINRQASRLKTIKDLLSGTGLGTQAYGIIEQGRVEILLQSSSVQRRSIFEEAAGISRFNMKKQEVQRRLERVEQNILRLSDIVNELETQLRNTKSQAGKAQLYRQYTTRLQELRVHGSFIDWRKWNTKRGEIQEEIDGILKSESQLQTVVDELEKSLGEQEHLVEETTRKSRQTGGEIAAVRERIGGEESNIELQLVQVEEMEAEIVRHGRQLIDLNLRNTDTEEMMRQTDEELRQAGAYFESVSQNFQVHVNEAEEIARKCAEIEKKRDVLREELDANHRLSSRLSGEISGYESRQSELLKTKAQNEKKMASTSQQVEELTGLCADLRKQSDDLAQKVVQRKEQLESVKARKLTRQEELETLRAELLTQKQRQSGLAERTAVLEELLKRHEGISPGVREFLRQPRTPDSPYRHVHGLVADLFRVHVEAASLIEIALGPAAQYVVVSPEADIIRVIERTASQLPGRVGFLWLEPRHKELGRNRGSGFEGRPGVHGRADQFVETDPMFVSLVQKLLARTWIVESLTLAKSLYQESDGRTGFLTVAGEYLAADGTLVVGPLHGISGVIARRSELRTLVEQLQQIDGKVREMELDQEVLQVRLVEDEQSLEQSAREHQRVVSELETLRIRLTATTERLQQMENQSETFREEFSSVDCKYEKFSNDLEKAKSDKEEIDEKIQGNESEFDLIKTEYDNHEKLRSEQVRKLTNIKIELAKSEGRLDFLNDRKKQFRENQKERLNHLTENRKRLDALKRRRDLALLSILNMGANLAMLYCHKEEFVRIAKQEEKTRSGAVAKRTAMFAELKRTQQELHGLQSQRHARQIEVERLQQETRTLMQRILDDYGIDLADWTPTTSVLAVHHAENEEDGSDGSETVPQNYQQEIEELREKIQKLGSVNLEAIETLESLETRFTTLSNQYQDLLNAKKSIEKIIDRINIDSQRLFEETFNGVKQHFHEIFQKLFGGGHADLLLEDENNPLESGVEIVARPPGKDLKSVSLLSGGEKTLTCVALLLALFRFRPSPICILDEVDAALDEANIDRFARVIKEFDTMTQFLIVTHSKKTMAAADTIFGVTMQDSGVSIPISVRFVDVGENCEISLHGQHEAA